MSKIAACLIVKNATDIIGPTLESIRPFVDGIFIYDTGSTDATLSVLEKLNEDTQLDIEDGDEHVTVPLAPITVEQGEWRDDFSWAREQSFAMPDESYDWTVWLDDDDVVANAQNLRYLADTAAPDCDGFIFLYDYARDEAGNCVCQLWRERLIRRSAGYEWRNPVHEVQVPPEGRPPQLAMVPPEIIHYIHRRPPARYSPDRNLEILLKAKKKAEAEGTTPDLRTLAYLGTEYMAQGQFGTAAPFLQSYLESLEVAWSDERAQVHHKLATCLLMLGNPMGAVHVELEAVKERFNWAENYSGLTESYASLGEWANVEWYAKRVLELGIPQSMLILNPLEFTFLPYVRLSEACIATGRFEEALGWLEKAAALVPEHPLITERRESYEKQKFDAEIVGALLKLREVAVRYDENLKALALLENAPYVVKDHPLVVKARADQREMCKHYLRPEEYLRWYEDEPKESTLTDEHIDLVADAFGRVGGLLRGLEAQESELGRSPTVLDLGCNDWWMGEALARRGFSCDGIELNKRSYEKAIERRDRFERDVEIWQGDLHKADQITGGKRYDAVVLFEVLEHVPDMDKTLAVMEKMLLPGGRVYLSTPNGAFEDGNLPAWHVVERKGHLRAIPIHDLAAMLQGRGELHDLEHTNGDRVAFASYSPKRHRGKIVFYNGPSWEPWGPLSVLEGGIGGSESALVRLSAALARLDYEVHVYADVEPCISSGGVLWHRYTSFDPTEESDLLVVSRMPHVFDNPIGAKQTALWCHDHSYQDLTEERAERIDHVIVLSDWERDRFARLYPFLEDKLRVIRNGVAYFTPGTKERAEYLSGAERGFLDRKPRCVYTSSADRGLDVMLKVWPKIRATVPDAELHIFYGFQTLDRVALRNPGLVTFKQSILNSIAELEGEEGGIFLRGRVGQPELLREMSEARVLSYPTAFLETSCISAMEARSAGLPIVTSDLAALKETVGSKGIRIEWAENEDEPENQTAEYQDKFVASVTELLTNDSVWSYWHDRGLLGVTKLDWSHRAKEWAALTRVRELIAA